MSNTIGDSTRRRLAAAVSAANAANGGAGRAAGGGGYGGMAGSFGRAPTGRGLDPGKELATGGGLIRPSSAGQVRPASAHAGYAAGGGVGSGPSRSGCTEVRTGAAVSPDAIIARVKEMKRLAAVGARVNAFTSSPQKELPRATPHALTAAIKVRPSSAAVTKAMGPMASIQPVEYRLQGTGLAGGGSGSGGDGGGGSAGQFGGVNVRNTTKPFDVNVMRQAAALSGSDPVPYASAGGAVRPASSPANYKEVSEASLATLEDTIRDAVRLKRSVYEGSKEMLLRVFKSVDDGSGDVDHREFIQVCAQLGISVSPPEAQALFQRFGYGSAMPYQKFATTLLTQPSRALATDMPTRKGAFQAGASADFHGKIQYDKCRKAVYTPHGWDPAVAERSAELPNARLVLEYVYGYQGAATSQNCFYTANGQVVYFVAGLGVVYTRPPVHQQHFFLGHNDDVKSLAICRATIDVNGKQYPAGSLVATGQVTATENGAYVCIWDSRVGSLQGDPELVKLQFDKEARGITALAFSPDGTRLVCVATDNGHTVYVYDWRRQRLLSDGRGMMGDPPQVYGVEWNPYEVSHQCASAFVTFGKKHIKLWTATNNQWSAKSLSVGRLPMQHVMSAAWLPPRQGGTECLIVGGMADGQLYIFKGGAALRSVAAHPAGPSVVQPDGHPGHHGVRGMRLTQGDAVLLTGGADGVILSWDVSDGSLVEGRMAAAPIVLQGAYGPHDKPPRVRSLDYAQEGGTILVGTNTCDVLEVTASRQDILVTGHAGDVWAVAFHPVHTEVMATVTDSGRVFVFDVERRAMLYSTHIACKPRSVAFSMAPLTADGAYHLAVGGDKGQIHIMSDSNLQPQASMQDAKEGISDLKYSPNNKYLAAATYDNWIDVYNVEKGYSRVCRCTGHSSVVAGIDWTTDSSILQSHSNDYDLLYWIAKSGKQVPIPPRDLSFATFTSKLGFSVMGIWPVDADNGHFINMVARSNNAQYVVTTDDNGLVKLFNYPCVVDDAPYRAYRGHSSHVMSARFNRDDSKVVSVGGKDWAVFQFRFVELAPPGAAAPPPVPVWGPIDPSGRTYGYALGPTAGVAVGVQPLPTLHSPTPSAGNGQQQLDASRSFGHGGEGSLGVTPGGHAAVSSHDYAPGGMSQEATGADREGRAGAPAESKQYQGMPAPTHSHQVNPSSNRPQDYSHMGEPRASLPTSVGAADQFLQPYLGGGANTVTPLPPTGTGRPPSRSGAAPSDASRREVSHGGGSAVQSASTNGPQPRTASAPLYPADGQMRHHNDRPLLAQDNGSAADRLSHANQPPLPAQGNTAIISHTASRPTSALGSLAQSQLGEAAPGGHGDHVLPVAGHHRPATYQAYEDDEHVYADDGEEDFAA